jgi:hypothetical protein
MLKLLENHWIRISYLFFIYESLAKVYLVNKGKAERSGKGEKSTADMQCQWELLWVVFFKTGSHYVAHAGFEL